MITTIVLLILFGVAAVILELVLPGGIIGIVGALLLLAASVLSFIHHGAAIGGMVSAGILVFSGLSIFIWMKNFDRMPLTKRMIVNDQVGDYDTLRGYRDLLGKTGIVYTDLRPSGAAIIEDRKVDVIAQAGVIPKGSKIEVVAVSGPSITVVEIS